MLRTSVSDHILIPKWSYESLWFYLGKHGKQVFVLYLVWSIYGNMVKKFYFVTMIMSTFKASPNASGIAFSLASPSLWFEFTLKSTWSFWCFFFSWRWILFCSYSLDNKTNWDSLIGGCATSDVVSTSFRFEVSFHIPHNPIVSQFFLDELSSYASKQKWKPAFSYTLNKKRQSRIGCICLAFLHCAFSNVSSNCLPKKRQSRIFWDKAFENTFEIV